MQKLQNISKLPVPTWSWLHINSTSLEVEPVKSSSNAYCPIDTIPDGVSVSLNPAGAARIPDAFITKETAEFARQNCNHSLFVKITKDTVVTEPVIIHYQLTDTETLVNNLYITIEEGAAATVVVHYESDHLNRAFHCGYVCVKVEKNAELQYIGVQNLGTKDTHADAFHSTVLENARLDMLMLELGAGQSSVAADVKLAGKGAQAALDNIYVGVRDSAKDYNYRMEFQGKEAVGQIVVKGVLGGSAQKNMKSTIDFITGASGSKGREEETVLVLSDAVVNRSAPLLLCGEDDVEGEHATSIGKPNKDQMYYLMTRGFTEKEAKKLLVEASLIPLLDKVNQEALRSKLTSLVQEVIGNAE